MNLSLKERYKLLGKLGVVFMIMYYLILIFNITCICNYIIEYNSVNRITFTFFGLLIFNIVTMWKLNKLSFWSTIISVLGLINKCGSIAFEDFFLNSLAVQSEGYVEYKSNSFEIFSGISTIFLLIFLVFISIKREVFGFKGKSTDMDELK